MVVETATHLRCRECGHLFPGDEHDQKVGALVAHLLTHGKRFALFPKRYLHRIQLLEKQ